MKRTLLFATIAVCTFHLTVGPRSGVAETKMPSARAGRAIAVEVLIVSVQADVDAKHAFELSGPSDKVTAQLRQLEAEGQIVGIERIQMTTLENQEASFQAGRIAPVATARSSGGRAGPQTSYRQQSFGTQISALARVDGDTIVVALEVEKSQLERPASTPQTDDEFVPLGTTTLTSHVTLRIGSGKTVLAGSIEKRAGAQSSAQLVLASARLLEPSPEAEDVAPTDAAAKQQIRIFSLQRTAAEAAAAIIKDLAGDDSAHIKMSVDSRTNSLIVATENERQLAVVEAILLRLDEAASRPGPQSPMDTKKAKMTPKAAKYDTMGRKNLEAELKRLQGAVLEAKRIALQARKAENEAQAAYRSAGDDEKADALLRLLEAKAAGGKPSELFRRVNAEFQTAQQAYLAQLVTE